MSAARTWKVSYQGNLQITGIASWFGGGADPGDNGETASGIKNDGSNPNLMGCALPLSWDGAEVASCQASPLGTLPWGTMVEVKADNGKIVTVPLIDVGPALDENRPIDLTVAAFKALGGDLTNGLISITFTILTNGLAV
jgi:rare lipoprotein A (peptidoglycan hydrolase)